MITLGIDTSNYTTSCALYFSDRDSVVQKKQLLPVKEGEKGLRQSDAVFHHTRQLPALMSSLFEETGGKEIDAVGVSVKPRDIEGSYMPCFTVGSGTAESIGAVTGKPVYGFSHQSGHIAAALYSAGRLDLIEKEFIAFHVSGGTTEVLIVSPDSDKIIKEEIIGKTNDISCGQAVDRCGVMMGLPFPCGKYMEELALRSGGGYKISVSVSGCDCNLSGLENKCREMYESGAGKENTAGFCLEFISLTLDKMTSAALDLYPGRPVVYSGGVMSNSIIKKHLSKYPAVFAEPEFSCDNACGAALLAYLKGRK